jgi:hypothetical protein
MASAVGRSCGAAGNMIAHKRHDEALNILLSCTDRH